MTDLSTVGTGNAGLRLLDACFDDLGYARYLLTSKRLQDIEIRTKVNWRDHATGNSILHCLAYSDLEPPLQLLLQHHADPNIRNKANEVPLHWCAKVNATKCIQTLLQYKANINAVDLSNSSALHYAVSNGHIEMTVLLLDHDIDVYIQDSDGHTAFDIAVESGKSENGRAMIAVLLRHCQRKGLSIPKAVRGKLVGIVSVQHDPATTSSDNINTSPSPPQQAQQQPRPFEETASYNQQQAPASVVAENTMNISPPRAVSHSRAPSFFSAASPSSFPTMLLAHGQQPAGLTPLNSSTSMSSPSRSASFAMNLNIVDQNANQPKAVTTMLDMIRSGDLKPLPSPMSKSNSVRNLPLMLEKIKEESRPSTPSMLTRGMSSANVAQSLLRRGESMSPAAMRRGSMSPNTGTNINGNNSPVAPPTQQQPQFIVRKVHKDRGDFLSASFGSLAGLEAPAPSKKGLSRSMAEPRRVSMDMQQLYFNQQQQNMPVDDSLIAQQAKELARRLGAADHPEGLVKPQPILTAASAFPKTRRHMSASETLSPAHRHVLYSHDEATAQVDTTQTGGGASETATTMLTTDSHNVAAAAAAAPTVPATPKRVPTLAETSFPPADMLPFLPNPNPEQLGDLSPAHLDVIIAVEHCFDCHLHNSQSLRHDTKKYVSQANAVIYGLIKAIAEARLAVRVFAMRTQPMSMKRLGAMEVTVAVRINLPKPPAPSPKAGHHSHSTPMANRFGMSGFTSFSPFSTKPVIAADEGTGVDSEQMNHILTQHQLQLKAEMEEEERQKLLQRWCTHRLHSKLQTKNWPHPKQLEQKVVKFLEATIREAISLPNKYNYDKDHHRNDGYSLHSTRHDQSHHHGGSHHSVHPKLEFKHTEPSSERSKQVMRQYAEWTNRMKIPPKVEKHHLDHDHPDLDLLGDGGFFDGSSTKGRSGAELLEAFLSCKISEAVHPPGPMVDMQLAAQLKPGVFERAVLKHFLVFDNRFEHAADAPEPEEAENKEEDGEEYDNEDA